VEEETDSLETARASEQLLLLLGLLAVKNSYCATSEICAVLLMHIKVLWPYDAVWVAI
jgi:hypothetical protein